MKICVYGLGAIGGLMAAKLVKAGNPVRAVARGATLEALRREGLTLIDTDATGQRRSTVLPIEASERPAELGVQDLVIVAVKTTALPAVARDIEPLLGPDTMVLSAMNGIPWWFFHRLTGAPPSMRLESVDPAGAISRAIPPQQVLGCVVHLAAIAEMPGVIRHVADNRLIVGAPDGKLAPRVQAIRDMLAAAGFDATASERIQQEIWFKLWGNMTVNPISAITGATGDRILDDDNVRHFMTAIMREAADIGRRIGVPIDIDPEERHGLTRKLGAFRTSMLQDVEAGKPVELDAMVAAVIEIGRQVGVATPCTDALFGLARLHARVRGLYPGA
ncbi:2-dehydropantoate 2-reductase [Pandoraea sp.]|uniref:2-dehydropantoate 2-reductase n=1 Tax=Pandoraea sp. TaxID=1883445 RepID=UPI001220AE7C|nr:2-dehydropantoate 2-reductase [Pandoraea sp.]MDE2287628.1 2-dehydropantoate 2-reductase [Burkholderiales bacterium]TAL54082.1 MAG: 2-dehydropantoate 2-reductase [Pandoraea sp.]TAM14194.1 MAG: 2-dehydropantoate 2-reductase [Pandoraea sp.]